MPERPVDSDRSSSQLAEHDARTLAALHGSEPLVAAATLEVCPERLREWLDANGYREPRPDKPHLSWLSAPGWDLVAELAARWTEDELVAYFKGRYAALESRGAFDEQEATG